jgi:hypothetical protein
MTVLTERNAGAHANNVSSVQSSADIVSLLATWEWAVMERAKEDEPGRQDAFGLKSWIGLVIGAGIGLVLGPMFGTGAMLGLIFGAGVGLSAGAGLARGSDQ